MRLAACLLTLAPGVARSAEYSIAPAEGARFELRVHKTGLMSGKLHLFLFPKYEGKLVYDAAHPETAKLTLSIDSASAECKDDWVSASQLTDIEKYAFELLAVEQHPRIVFESDSIAPAGDGTFTVKGSLTIAGKVKPATASVGLRTDGERLRFTGSAAVDLRDYGIKPRRAFLGVIGTKNVMNVAFELIAVPAG